jgi:hypothetical protein
MNVALKRVGEESESFVSEATRRTLMRNEW